MNFAFKKTATNVVKGLLLMGALLFASTAWAGTVDSITADLTYANSGLSGSPASSYGTVTLGLNGDGTISVDLAMAPGFGVAGGGNAFGFDVNGSTTGIDVSGLASGFAFSSSGGHLDGLGNYMEVITGPQASNAITDLSFVVSRTGGFDSALDLVALATGGSPNGYFAAHVIPLNGASTGYAAATSYTVTPEPETWLLLLTGLCGMAFVLRRNGRGQTTNFPVSL
jgi:hypothetical protein